MTLTPEQMLQKTTELAKQLVYLNKHYVVVGLPNDKVGEEVYGEGSTIIENGARHEFGYGNNPARSFIVTPFRDKRREINEFNKKQFEAVFNGRPAKDALGFIGVNAQNISKIAFDTGGYGRWPDIQPATKKSKGSAKILVDTGILKGSITWVIR